MDKIGDRIKELRKKSSMTQYELAAKIGMTASAIGMYEQNRREPHYEIIQQISRLFSVTADFLLFGQQEQLLESPLYYKTKEDDFHAIIDNLKDQLMDQKGLMFKGETLDDDDLEKVFDAMKIGAEVAFKSKKK